MLYFFCRHKYWLRMLTSAALVGEAYLLWLFGCIMFNNSHGDSVDRVLMPYAREIVDATDEDVPTWSWGLAVLPATYRGLCDACSKTNENAILTGCPLLLQLWAYER